MAELTEFKLDEGTSVYVETTELAGPGGVGTEEIGRAEDVAREAASTLEEALEALRPTIGAIASKVRDIAGAADELQVKFGVKLAAAAGVIIAKAGAEANFEFTAKWARD